MPVLGEGREGQAAPVSPGPLRVTDVAYPLAGGGAPSQPLSDVRAAPAATLSFPVGVDLLLQDPPCYSRDTPAQTPGRRPLAFLFRLG